MKIKNIIIAVIILALAGTTGYFGWLSLQSKKSENNVRGSEINDPIEYYHCGMHPWVKSDKPGKCSICGMELTPVYKGGKDLSEGIISVDPAMIQNLGVKTEAVMKRKLSQSIRTTGYVDYDETRQAYITIKFSGYIEKLYVDYEGKQVQQGAPLFEIYSPELVAAQQEYLQALRFNRQMLKKNGGVLSGSDELLQSARQKLMLWDISGPQVNHLEQSGEIKKTLTVYSPFSGFVVEKNVFEGMQVQAGMNVMKLADLSRIWVYADVYENDLQNVESGIPAQAVLPFEPGKIMEGRVSYIYPYLRDQSRTAKVRLEFPNPKTALKKDMYVTVQIFPAPSAETVAIPEQAVIRSGKRDVVVLAAGEGKFISREIILGIHADGWYEVKEGLNEGDSIVTSSQFLIDSESNLKSGMASMSAHAGHSGQQPMTNGENNAEHKPGINEMQHENHQMNMNNTPSSMPAEAVDPVCGMKVSTGTKLKHTYKGDTYYFCSAADLEKFKNNPEKYLSKK